jgi:hypothetical protein
MRSDIVKWLRGKQEIVMTINDLGRFDWHVLNVIYPLASPRCSSSCSLRKLDKPSESFAKISACYRR